MLEKKKKLKIPGIGARIVKSALAVVLCMIVNVVRGDEGIVFYSQLAALWCIQMYRDNTVRNAFQRITGTIVGAVYGLVYILIFPYMNSYVYYLKEKYKIEKMVTFGTVPNRYDILVNDGSFNEMVRLVRRRYEPILGKMR